MKDLLGEAVRVPLDLDPDDTTATFRSLGAYSVTTSPLGVEKYRAAARDLARQVFVNPKQAEMVVGCAPSVATDPCVTVFVRTFGRRAWRRPLANDEVARYLKLVGTTAAAVGTVSGGLEHALAAMLQSPNFLYLPELGETDPGNPARLRFTRHEMASRLSYLLWGSMPDAQLQAAADQDALQTPAGIRAQAERLLASPRARWVVGRFFLEHFAIDELSEVAKSSKVYPTAKPALLGSMQREAEAMVVDLALERRGDFRDVFTNRRTVLDTGLSTLYGVTPPARTGMAPFTFPPDSPRSGILTTAAFLTAFAQSDRSSPTLRGVFIRERLLCQHVPPPPPDVNNDLPEPAANAPARTTAERLALHRTNPTCAGCHAVFDPLGLAFEHFDGMGAYREKEKGLPILTKADLDGRSFDGAAQLGALLREDVRATECLVRQFFRHALGHAEAPAEEPAIEALLARFASAGYDLRALLTELVTSDAFRFASPATTAARTGDRI